MSQDNAVIELPQKSTDLAVSLTDKSIDALSNQRVQLKKFIQSQLKEGLDGDYAKIPGTQKYSLLKPGAEKLANIFQLGSRIVNVEKDIDHQNDFAMFTYTVEMFHIPSGKAISQCQGSTNSQEKKYRTQKSADILNTLQKMAQKRAYVGAVIMAVGASDFFTQDTEDMAQFDTSHTVTSVAEVKRVTKRCECGEEMMISKYNQDQWFCAKCKAKVAREKK